MKKLLLMAFAAMAAVCAPTANAQRNHIKWTTAQTPVANTLKDGGIYLIYDHSKPSNQDSNRRAMRYVASATATGAQTITGNSTLSCTAAGECDYNLYAWEAIQDGTSWKFKHIGTGKYIKNVTGTTNPLQIVVADATESNVGKWNLIYNSTEQAFKVQSATTTAQYWDGQWSDDSYNMVTWNPTADSGTHFYQFFEITDDIISDYKVTVNWKKGDDVVCTAKMICDKGATLAAPEGVATGSSITVGPNALNAEFTLADGVEPFKIASARARRRWGQFNTSGLTTIESTENTTDAYASADWLLEVPGDVSGQFKIYAPSKGKYLGSIANSADPTALAATDNAAGLFTITRKQTTVGDPAVMPYWASEQIQNVTNNADGTTTLGNGFNLRDNHVAGWSSTDVGSQWFMVYDYETFVVNREFFSSSDASLDNNNTSGRISAAVTNAKQVYDDLKAEGKTDEYLAGLLAAINKVYTLRLGKKGVSAEAYINELTAEIDKLDTSKRDFLLIKSLGDALYDASTALIANLPDEIVNNAAVTTWPTVSATKTSYSENDVVEITKAYNALYSLVKNDSHVLIRHNSQANGYIAVDANNHWYRGTESTDKRAFTLKVCDDGGFYLYNEYSNQYLKFVDESNVNQANVASQTDASRFVFDHSDNGRVGIKCIDVTHNMPYLHSNQTSTVLRYLSGANSSWYIELCSDDRAAAEHLQGAKDSRNFYFIDSASDVTGFYSGKVSDADIKAVVDMPETTIQDKRDKADAIYAMEALSEDDFTLNMPTTGKLYTIRCTDTANARGNLQYATGYDVIATSGRHGVAYDAEDPNQQWAIYKDADGKMYLYNVGAKKFANTYYVRTEHSSGASKEDFAWRFFDIPTEITAFSAEGMSFDATEGHGFSILGGENTTSGRRPGMFIVNGIATNPNPSPVLASAGFSNSDNGIGFWLTEVGIVSDELDQEMGELYDGVANKVAEAKTAYDAAYAAEANEDVIGHYTAAGHQAYTSAGTKATATGAGADTKHFYYNKGLAADRVGLEHEGIYTLQTSENKHYAVIKGVVTYTEEAAKVIDTKTGKLDNTHYWQANVDANGVVSFTHQYDPTEDEKEPKPKETLYLEHNGATQFTVTHGAPGVVTLVTYVAPAPAEAPAMRKVEGENADEAVEPAAVTFTITKAGDDAEAATTSINEITVDGVTLEGAIYDLQGRRLAAPVKGINIIGGRKVLVK